MPWTTRTNTARDTGSNTIDVLWTGESDGSELTDEVIVDVSTFILQGGPNDGTAATGFMLESYELSLYGRATTLAKYVFLEGGSQFLDLVGSDQTISGPKTVNPANRVTQMDQTGDFTVTTVGTDADDIVRVRATLTLT